MSWGVSASNLMKTWLCVFPCGSIPPLGSKPVKTKRMYISRKNSRTVLLDIIMRGATSTSSLGFQTFIFWLWGKWHHCLIKGLKIIWHPVGQSPNLFGCSHSARVLNEPLLAIPLFYQTSCLQMIGYRIGSLNSMGVNLLLHNFCIDMSPFVRGNVG